MKYKIYDTVWHVLHKIPTPVIGVGAVGLIGLLYVKSKSDMIGELIEQGIYLSDENGNIYTVKKA